MADSTHLQSVPTARPASQRTSGAVSNLFARGRKDALDNWTELNGQQAKKADHQPTQLKLRFPADAKLQLRLGRQYLNGDGIPPDEKLAVSLISSAAEQGLPEAEAFLGWLYHTGTGLPKSDANAKVWFGRAADRGYAYAQYGLGWLHERSPEMPADCGAAANYYMKAAEQDWHDAQYNLGLLFESGRGVPKDYAAAFFWILLSMLEEGEPNRDIHKRSLLRVSENLEFRDVLRIDREVQAWKSARNGVAARP